MVIGGGELLESIEYAPAGETRSFGAMFCFSFTVPLLCRHDDREVIGRR